MLSLTAVFTLICLASPSAGLMAFAALAPVSSAIERLAGGVETSGGLMLEQLVLALGTGALVRFGQTGPRTRITPTRLTLKLAPQPIRRERFWSVGVDGPAA